MNLILKDTDVTQPCNHKDKHEEAAEKSESEGVR